MSFRNISIFTFCLLFSHSLLHGQDVEEGGQDNSYEVYRDAYRQALSDGNIDENEALILKVLENALGLSSAKVLEIQSLFLGQDAEEQGIQGEPGPGTRIVYSGMITSNEMTIVVPEMSIVDPPSIDVLLCPSGLFRCFPTPIFFTIDDIRFETWFTTNDQFVEIFNALAFAGDNATYAIIVIQ